MAIVASFEGVLAILGTLPFLCVQCIPVERQIISVDTRFSARNPINATVQQCTHWVVSLVWGI